MKALVRHPASAFALLAIGCLGDVQAASAQGTPPPPEPPSARDRTRTRLDAADMAALEKLLERAVMAAVDKAVAETTDRLQKMPALSEAASLRQKLGELEKLRDEIRAEISRARSTLLQYALWAGVGLFGIMVLASVVGGAIVAAIVGRLRSARA